MTPLYITNDWHLGAVRSGGTTPATAYQLRQDLLSEFESMLNNIAVDGDLALNGDLFDGPNISMADLASTMQSLVNWLMRTGRMLYAVTGNHDISKNSTNYSSFEFLAKMLQAQFPEQVRHVFGGEWIRDNIYVVSHVPNQDIFNLELEKVPKCDYLLLHCNYNNHFAQESDHSLNLSETQAMASSASKILLGHEHQQRSELGGKVVVVGNPRPSSISDCLGNGTKRMLKITDAGMEFIETWKAEGDFSEQDWKDLKDEGRFIRITGTADPEEASRVVDVIARFRRDSNARVVSNAVKIGENDTSAEMVLTHEEVTSFNVMGALREFLGPDDAAEVDKIMKEHNAQ